MMNESSEAAVANATSGDSLVMAALYMTLFVVGVVGNTLVLLSILHIFAASGKSRIRRGVPNVVFVYVLGLSVTDLFVVSHLPFIAFFLVYRRWVFGGLVCRLFYYAENANKIISTLMLTAMSWDRYIAVCHASSFHFRKYRTAVLIVLFCFLVSTAMLLPFLLLSDIYDKRSLLGLPIPNDTEDYTPDYVCVFQLQEPWDLAFSFSIFGFGYAIPGLLMFYFYVKVLGGLKSHSMTQAGLERAKKVSFRVLCLVLFYFFCWTPYWIGQFVIMLNLLPGSPIVRPFSHLAYFLTFLNSSGNPILYAVLNRELRRCNTEALGRRLRSIANVKKTAVLLMEKHSERLLHMIGLSMEMDNLFGSGGKTQVTPGSSIASTPRTLSGMGSIRRASEGCNVGRRVSPPISHRLSPDPHSTFL